MKKQIVLILVGLICLTSIAYAGVSANYDLSWHVLSGGGSGQMDSATYALSSTVGQVSGYSESSNYRMGAGYWYGIVSADTPQTTGTIKITSDPTGAMIEFDGERAVGPMSITPTTFTTSPGTHTIKLSQDGYQDWSTSVDVTAGGLSEVHGTLTPTAQIKFDTLAPEHIQASQARTTAHSRQHKQLRCKNFIRIHAQEQVGIPSMRGC